MSKFAIIMKNEYKNLDEINAFARLPI